MPLIDVKCQTCAHVNEVMRPLAMYPATPPCPDCGAETEQIHLPPSARWTAPPVVVFKAPDGTYRFPGDAGGLSAKSYEQQGYERVEIRGAVEMRRFEGKMNAQERARAERHFEQRQRHHEARLKETRSELYRQMQNMSELGRAVARAAMARNDAKPLKRVTDTGFHSDVYANYRSNRDESRDPQGRRRRD
jgi:hypothetical protein